MDRVRRFLLTLLVISVVAVLGLASRQAGLTSRTVSEVDGHPIVVSFPMVDGAVLEMNILRATAAARVPVGLERVRDEPLPDRVRRNVGSPERAVLTGHSLGDVLNLLTAQAPPLLSSAALGIYRFSWQEHDGMISVTPVRGQASFLDTLIPVFELKAGTLSSAATAIHRFFDPQFPDRSGAADQTPPSMLVAEANYEAYLEKRTVLKKPFSVALTNVTVRQVLDGIAKAHGEVSWIVTYHDTAMAYAQSRLSFAAFNGARLDFTTSRRK